MDKEKQIHGDTSGIKDSIKERISALYDMEQTGGVFVSYELLAELAALTQLINREISVFISRGGRIMDVSVGDSKTVSLPQIRLVRNIDRLCGVRCIHTHPNGSGILSDVDLGTLNASRLDSMAAVGVRDGKPTSFYAAFVGEREGEERIPVIYGPLRSCELPQQQLLDAIMEADARLMSSAYAVTQAEPERAILVGMDGGDGYDSLEELAALADSAGLRVVHKEFRRKRVVDNTTYIGSGKADELRLIGNAMEADVFLFDDELSAIQIRNLELILSAPVIDRTTLILDIFATRATSREGKLQVELAQYKYRLPRLLGMGAVLSRQGSSGVGMRGPGEKKLEIDRRRIHRRIFELETELSEIEKQRTLRRDGRKRGAQPLVALVGYTNAGKSTLLNRLTDSEVLAEDKLFATLDPVVRRLTLPSGRECLLSDTVGFINKLPHDLISAFQSTLEEVRDAQLILHVIDSTSDYFDVQQRVVRQVLDQLGAGNTPCIELYNKVDSDRSQSCGRQNFLPISARTGEGVDELLKRIDALLGAAQRELTLTIPYERYELTRLIHDKATVLEESHEAEGTKLHFLIDEDKLWQLEKELPKDWIRAKQEDDGNA